MKIKIRCPKCRKTPVTLTESLSCYAEWSVEDNNLSDVAYNYPGDVNFVFANCSCGHCWRLRGITQITGLED